MGVINNNIAGIHLPAWEQWPTITPAASAIGTCIVSDNKRFIYYLVSATSFWRIDSWTGAHEQLASPTGGTVGGGTCMIYSSSLGKIEYGEVYGSILALITSGTGAPVFNKYDIASNTWTNLNVTNLPGTFGTDGCLCFPEPNDNNYETYHTSVINTITVASDVALNASVLTVTALPKALPANCILNFGTKDTPLYVHVTTAAAAGATSLTISASICTITSGKTALYYDHCYLIGNAATQIYRWQHTTSAWATTTANIGSATIPGISGAVGAGCSLKYLPGESFPNISNNMDQLTILRGAATSIVYRFDLVNNTMNAVTYNPATETFTTGTATATKFVNGKKTQLIVNRNGSQHWFKFDFKKARKYPLAFEEIIPPGTALVGDRSCIINQSGLDILYWILPTSSYMVRSVVWL